MLFFRYPFLFVSLLTLSFHVFADVTWVTKNCDNVHDFRAIWPSIAGDEPAVSREMDRIMYESDSINTDPLLPGSNKVLVRVDVCTMTYPEENSKPTNGLRTILIHKTWIKDGVPHAGGILVEYLFQQYSNVLERKFTSVMICRSVEACERRGLKLKKKSTGTEEPTPENPPNPPSPLKPIPEPTLEP
jgi:hypothetical protein